MGRPRGCGEACGQQGAVAHGRPAGLPSLTGAARQGPRTPQSRGHRPFPQKRFQRRKCSQQNVKGKRRREPTSQAPAQAAHTGVRVSACERADTNR